MKQQITSLKQQQGLSPLGVLAVMCLFAFIILCFFKVGPVYLDNFSVNSIIKNMGEEPMLEKKSEREIRELVERRFDVDMIDVVNVRQKKGLGGVEISKSKGVLRIAANYHKEVHMFGNLYVVVKFEDNVYEKELGSGS